MTIRRGFAALAVISASALLLGVAAAQSTSRSSVRVWLDWTGKFSAYSRLEAVSGTVNRAGATSTSEVSWHVVAPISVPTPLPPPDKPNEVAFLTLHVTPDSYLQETHKLCIDGSPCTTTGFVNTGDQAGVSGSAVSSYPEPVGTRFVTWSAELYSLFSFYCGSKKVTPEVEQQWATVTRQVDLGQIATGPAQGDQWSFAPAPLSGTNPGGPCTFRYEWSGTFRVSRIKPPAVTPPPPPPVSTGASGGVSPEKLKAMKEAEDDFLEFFPEAAVECAKPIAGAVLITAATAGGATMTAAAITEVEAAHELMAEALTGIGLAGWEGKKCADAVKRLAADWKTMHDPPLPDYTVVARLRPASAQAPAARAKAFCAGRNGATLAFCRQLEAALDGLLATSGQVAAGEQARAQTMGRLSAARAKGNAAATAKQLKALTTLDQPISARRAAEARAGAKLAALLRAAHLSIRQPAAQSSRAIANLLSRLQRAGVPTDALRSLVPGALTPKARDYVAVLAKLDAASPARGPSPGAATSPVVSSVTFGGSAANPAVVIHGRNLGSKPQPIPAGHPSGQGGCPTIAADDGYDFGTSLYIVVPAKNWSGGRARTGETDCIDLVVMKFTSTEVDFHFGRPYARFYPKFSLDEGDQVQVVVNGASRTVHVKYGATVTS